MRKDLATLKGLINGDVSIAYIHKTAIKGTPGDMTQMGHQ